MNSHTFRQEEFGSEARRSRGVVSSYRDSTERATKPRSQRTLADCGDIYEPRSYFWLALFLSLFAIPQLRADSSPPVDFNQEIRPLFAKHCTACHGGVKAASGISFLYRDQALAEGKSGEFAIVPGKPSASEVIRRVTSADPDEIMPQPSHGPPLTPREIASLRLWIEQGSKWSEHWSFVPPSEPARPQLQQPSWPVVPADEFVLARLEAEHLKPSPPAAPAEWLRRVSLDLTGLPPSIQEFEDFAQDHQQNPRLAKQRAVDRLLTSPGFGERWASVWLDLARYSDTFGYEKDPARNIWPWRDWVIRALNNDMPFDQFTIKQLAGDLLPSPSADDLLATAFHRNTQNNTEGGTDDEEYRTVAVLDRVNTTWTAWQAATFACAQCHSHPYDPFPHQDYYRFAAFFNNSEDCDQNDDFPRFTFPDDPEKREESVLLQLNSRRLLDELQHQALALSTQIADWKPIVPTAAKATGGQLTIAENGRINASGTLPISVKYTLTLPPIPGLTALKIDIFPESSDPKKNPERGQVFSKIIAELVIPGATNEPVKFKEALPDYLAGPFDPRKVIGDGGGFGSYPVQTASRSCIVVLDKPLPASTASALQITFEHGVAANSGFQGCPLKHFALAASQDSRLTSLVHAEERINRWKKWQDLRDRARDLAGPAVPILLERSPAAARETRVFIRGNRLAPADAVSPGIPNVVQPPAKNAPLTRLDMAQWLVSDRNPLAARVLANRLWSELFGRGIVETLEDFGTSGARPTHPELLDHLALRLRGQFQWSIKRFLRELALSAAYGQASRATPALLEKDPRNQLYARGPRVRLTAEMVRDQALAVSGLLSPKQFGPPVFPPQPPGIWSTVYSGEQWNTATNENRFRRAIYTYNRRTSGYPAFLTFDAPTRDACTARRIPSNTPLQALNMLNDPAFMELAQALAARMRDSAASPRDQIIHGARLLTLEPPRPSLINTLWTLYEGALADYRAEPELASQLADTPEQAALALVANTLLNLDPFIIR